MGGGGSSEGVGCTWWRWGGRGGAGIEGEQNTGRDQLSKTSAIRPADNRKGRGRGGGMVKRREREGGQKGSSFTPSMSCSLHMLAYSTTGSLYSTTYTSSLLSFLPTPFSLRSPHHPSLKNAYTSVALLPLFHRSL